MSVVPYKMMLMMMEAAKLAEANRSIAESGQEQCRSRA